MSRDARPTSRTNSRGAAHRAPVRAASARGGAHARSRASSARPRQSSAPSHDFRQPALWTKDQPRTRTSASRSSRASSAPRPNRSQPKRGSRSNASSSSSVLQTVTSALGAVAGFVGLCLRKLGSALVALLHRSKAAFAVVVVVCVLVVGYVADGFATSSRAYQGVSVGSVDVSGMTKSDIAAAIDETYGQPLRDASVTIFASEDAAAQTAEAAQQQSQQDAALAEQMAVDEAKASKQAWTVQGSDLGVYVDADALAEQALAIGRADGGFLSRLGAQLFGANVAVNAAFNDTLVDEFASQVDSAIGQPRVDYNIAVSSGVAYVRQGHDGWEINRQSFASDLGQAMLSGGGQLIAHTDYAPLRISQDAATTVAQAVTQALSQGAEFDYNGHSWKASASEVGAWVATSRQQQGDGSWYLHVYIDNDLAKSSMLSGIRQADGNALSGVAFSVDANGSVRVSTGGRGSLPLVSDAADALTDALFGTGTDVAPAQSTPHIQVSSTDMPAELSFDDAVALGVVGPIGTYTTQFTTGSGTENRNHNIELVSQLLNNSVCSAGNTWSYNDTTGNCDEEKGFLGAGAIIDGEYTDSVGGGICQVATTVFNAVYESGLPVKERHNHSLYIASYPQGRDAAVSYPELDLVWQNDTANDVLVKVSTAEGSVTATLYGVDSGYVVSTETGQWEAGKKYSTTTKVDASLAPGTSYVKTRGTDGSTIEVTRTVKDVNGNIVRQDLFASVYDPVNEVVVKGPETTAG